MGQGFGPSTNLGDSGRPIQVLANLAMVRYKTGGITIDWSTVTAVAADTTLLGGAVVKNGKKYLRHGQIMCQIGVAEVQTLTLTGGPTAGSAIFTLPAFGIYPAQNFTIAHNQSAVTAQDAINALDGLANLVTVTRAGAGSAGDPYIFTVTFNRQLGNMPQFTLSSHTFTGGTTPTGTPGTSTAGSGTDEYGPYDPSATDGRQTLARGRCWILNEDVLEEGPLGFNGGASDHAGNVFDGGEVYRQRLLATTKAAGTLADGPTFANFETAFPGITYVDQ